MKVQLEELSATRRRLQVEVPSEKVQEVLEGIFREIRKKAKIKGFREGRAPLSIVKSLYRDYAHREAVSRLVEETLPEAFKAHSLEPVAVPEIEPGDFSEADPFVYTALVDVRPEVKLQRYKGLKIQVEELEPVGEEEVQRELDRMREYAAQLKPLEGSREVRKGDWVLLDFVAYLEGKPVKDGRAENHLVEVGSGSMIPGFEDALIGMVPWEEKEFTLRMPDDHPRADLAGREVTFRVTVKEIRQKVLPELDDEFAKDMGYETLEGLRDSVRKELERRREEQQRALLRQKALEELLEHNPLEVPQSLVEERARELLGRIQARVGNIPRDKLAETYEQCRTIAEREIKTLYLVEEIAKAEGITVEDSELEEYLKELRVPEALWQSEEVRERARRELVREKVFELLIREAEVVH